MLPGNDSGKHHHREAAAQTLWVIPKPRALISKQFILLVFFFPLLSFGQELEYGLINNVLPKPCEISDNKISMIIMYNPREKLTDTIKYNPQTGLIQSIKYYYNYHGTVSLLGEEINYYYTKKILDSIVTTDFNYFISDTGYEVEEPDIFSEGYDSLGRNVSIGNCWRINYIIKNNITSIIMRHICSCDTINDNFWKEFGPHCLDTTYYYYDWQHRLIKIDHSSYKNLVTTYTYEGKKITEMTSFGGKPEKMEKIEYIFNNKEGKLKRETWSAEEDILSINIYYYKNGMIRKHIYLQPGIEKEDRKETKLFKIIKIKEERNHP